MVVFHNALKLKELPLDDGIKEICLGCCKSCENNLSPDDFMHKQMFLFVFLSIPTTCATNLQTKSPVKLPLIFFLKF